MDEVVSPVSMAVSQNGSRLYAGFENCVRIFEVASPGRPAENRATTPSRRSKDGLKGLVSSLAVSPQPGIFAAGTFSGGIGLYADAQPDLIAQIACPSPSGISQLAFSPDGRELFAASRRDREICVWDLRRSDRPTVRLARDADTNQRVFFDVSADGSCLVSGDQHGKLLIFALERLGLAPDEDLTMLSGDQPRRLPFASLPAHDGQSACE